MMERFYISHLLQIPAVSHVGLADRTKEPVNNIVIDTRKVKDGDLFVAINGANIDAHDFIDESVVSQAQLCVVSKEWYTQRGHEYHNGSFLVVEDTTTTLGQLARLYRDEFQIPVIGITGSNGKTTTKEMLKSVLSVKHQVCATSGNYNNLIGVPLTLFTLRRNHDIAVVEMGTNRPGEIGALCQIANPNDGIITNIGYAHMEGLSTLEDVAKEKTALYKYVANRGIRYINADDSYLASQKVVAGQNVIFGMDGNADVRIAGYSTNDSGSTVSLEVGQNTRCDVSIPKLGRHFAYSVAGAVAVGLQYSCGLDEMKEALSAFHGAPGRMDVFRVGENTVIDDTYNANPSSVKAAVDTLDDLTTDCDKVVVLGDMLELGHRSAEYHREVGEYIAGSKVMTLMTYGSDSKEMSDAFSEIRSVKAAHYTDIGELTRTLIECMSVRTILLVKGSRSMHMELIVEKLKNSVPVT